MKQTMQEYFSALNNEIISAQTYEMTGTISQITGLTVESTGPNVRLGDICQIFPSYSGSAPVLAEVVGFRESRLLLMPFGAVSGIGLGDKVVATNRQFLVDMSPEMKGRVLDALGKPMDGKGALPSHMKYGIDNDPPNPLMRRRIKDVMETGVKAIDSLLTLGGGQRMGIFAGSGVGKSTLLGMLARNAVADVNVITLIGERGREVLDFIEKDLREEGLKKSVLVVATSDQPALLRLKSAMVGTAVAEYFRDQGCNVLLMMDSLTRFAMAQREIGMAVGEPPVSHGYPPSVFAKLPRLLERSGTSQSGSITAIYTVLVDGDDMNEPISDAVRGILDGHIILSRELAASNHYPPIDVLHSVSRLMPDITEEEHYRMAGTLKGMLATYNEARDLINIGAYKPGSNPTIDRAIKLRPKINEMLRQGMSEYSSLAAVVDTMRTILQ